MSNTLRDSTGECIFCGEISFIKDEPCDCAKYKEHIAQQKAVAEGLSRLEELCAPDIQGWREPITADEYGELATVLEIVSRGQVCDIVVKLNNGTKIIFKDSGGAIGAERKEGGKSVALRC